MAKIDKAPWFVPLGNVLTTTLLRAGVKLVGFGRYPTYLLTVRGRKSGQPRTIPIVTIEQNGKRYLASPFGVVAWCAICGQREKPPSRVGVVLKRSTPENCLPERRPSFCEKISRVATPLLATIRSPRNLPLRSLSVRRPAIRCLCWKANSAGTPLQMKGACHDPGYRSDGKCRA